MGAYTCEFGVVHKTCRCPTPHTITCDRPYEHSTGQVDIFSNTRMPCYRLKNNLLGKHEVHEPHLFWYTSSGGGHYMSHDPGPNSPEKDVRRWICPGRP